MGPTKKQLNDIYEAGMCFILLSLPKDTKISSVELSVMLGISRHVARSVVNGMLSPHSSVKKVTGGHRNREVIFHITEKPDMLKLHSYITQLKIFKFLKYGSMAPKDLIEEVELSWSNVKELRAQNRTHPEFWIDFYRNGYRPCIFMDNNGNKTAFPFPTKPISKRMRTITPRLMHPYKAKPIDSVVPVTKNLTEIVSELEAEAAKGRAAQKLLNDFLMGLGDMIKDVKTRLSKEANSEGKVI